MTGLIGFLGGAAVVAGWIFSIQPLKQAVFGPSSMKVNTAIALAVAGLSLRLLGSNRRVGPALVLASSVAVLGLLTLAEYVLQHDLQIDEFFLTDAGGNPFPGRMAPATAACLLALGLSLLLSRRHAVVAQALSLAVTMVAGVASVGYLYDVRALYGITPYATMAVHTSLLLVTLAIGALWLNRDTGVVALLLAENLGGSTARRILPLAGILPVFFGWLILTGIRAGFFGTEFGLALLVVSMLTSLSVVLWLSARSIGKADDLRAETAHQLIALSETLEQRVAQQTAALAHSEAQFRLVLETAHDAFVAFDETGRICEWNTQAEVMFGWSRAEVMGRNASTVFIPPAWHGHFRRRLAQLLETNDSLDLGRREVEAMRRSGQTFPVEVMVSATRVESHRRFNLFIRDLTGLKRNEARFRALLESAPDAMLVVDNEGQVTLCNARAEGLFGFTKAELLEKPLEALVRGRRGGLVRDRTPAGGGTVRSPEGESGELRAVRRDGSEFPAEMSVSEVASEGTVLTTVAVRDISDRRAAQELLRSSLAEKEALLKEVHHRVKNNMQVTSSLLRLQARKLHDQTAIDALRASEGRILSMALLHENLYQAGDLARVDLGQYLRALASRLVSSYGRQRTVSIEVTTNMRGLEIDKAVPVGLLVNELVVNALKHAFPGNRTGRVSIDLHETAAQCVLTVTDNGVGWGSEPPDRCEGRSLGLQVVDTLSGQLKGRAEFLQNHGIEFRLAFPR